MDFTIGQQTLSEALNNLYRNTNDKFEAYGYVQIEVVNENSIRLMAENGINKLEYTLEARNATGTPILVNAKRFTDIINKLNGVITFHTNIILCEKTKIKINYKKGTIITPIVTENIENNQLNLKDFKDVVKRRLYAVEQKNDHSVVSNMYVNEQNIVSTNGNILSVGELKNPIYKSFLLSQSLAKEIITDFKDDEVVYISINPDTVIIWNDKFKIESRLKSGIFPPYQQLIPTLRDNLIEIKKAELINKLEIMSIVVEFNRPIIKFIFQNNELTLEHKQGKTFMEINGYSNETPFEIYFNLYYIISALKNTNDDIVKIQLDEESNLRPIIIKGENDLHLIMPVQVA